MNKKMNEWNEMDVGVSLRDENVNILYRLFVFTIK